MPLTLGTKLGNFEITGPLGKGGMGEVYRARDTKLGRNVAIKVLLGNRTYDNHPDGDRFLMINKASQLSIADSSDDIIVIENWFEELKRIAPVE